MQNEWIVGHEYNWHQIPIKRGEKTNHVISRPWSHFRKLNLDQNILVWQRIKSKWRSDENWKSIGWNYRNVPNWSENGHKHIVEMHAGQLPEAVLLANASTPSCIKIAFSIWVCSRRAVTRIMWMKIHANGRDIFSLLLSGVIWKYMLRHQKTGWILGDVHISW